MIETAEEISGKASVKIMLGDNRGALTDCNRAIQINPDFAEAYYYRGLVKTELGDKQGALSDYNQVIQINPN